MTYQPGMHPWDDFNTYPSHFGPIEDRIPGINPDEFPDRLEYQRTLWIEHARRYEEWKWGAWSDESAEPAAEIDWPDQFDEYGNPVEEEVETAEAEEQRTRQEEKEREDFDAYKARFIERAGRLVGRVAMINDLAELVATTMLEERVLPISPFQYRAVSFASKSELYNTLKKADLGGFSVQTASGWLLKHVEPRKKAGYIYPRVPMQRSFGSMGHFLGIDGSILTFFTGPSTDMEAPDSVSQNVLFAVPWLPPDYPRELDKNRLMQSASAANLDEDYVANLEHDIMSLVALCNM